MLNVGKKNKIVVTVDMSLCKIAENYNSCSFLYDPSINITLPKFKVIITYEDELIKVLGCNILERSDLDKVALFFIKQDASLEKRSLSKYILSIFKNTDDLMVWENLVKLKFSENKYTFEVT